MIRAAAAASFVAALGATTVVSTLGSPLLQTLAVVALAAATTWLLTALIGLGGNRLLLVPIALLSLLTFSSLLPSGPALVSQAAAMGVPFVLWWVSRRHTRGTRAAVLAVVAVLVFWTLSLLNPNVPDLITGLEGLRKTVLALVGLVLGASVAHDRRRVEDSVAALLLIALAVSIVGHFWLRPLVEYIDRDANRYTSEFGGEERLQGIFAGPFHISAAAVFLLGWAFVRFSDRKALSLSAIAVALIAIQLSMVRTGIVAAAAVLVVAALTLPMARRVRLIVIGSLAALGGIVVLLGLLGVLRGTAVGSIFVAATDGRVLNRFPGYRESIELFFRSPLWGWGPGSAGDALGDRFVGGLQHVTSHNLALKILVEGGFIGFALWVALAVMIWRTVDWRSASGRVALVSLTGLIVFGISGSGVEALPVTYFLFVLVGLAMTGLKPFRRQGSPERAKPGERG